jgi:poly-gamma-glutamate synthesis protein (capsule biosynthesis protein)
MSLFVLSLLRLACLGGLLLGLALLAGVASSARADSPGLEVYPWLYQRDNRPLGPAEEVVELIAVGDVMLGRGVAVDSYSSEVFETSALSTPQPLSNVAGWLREADLVLGNLESVIGVEAAPRPGLYAGPEQQPYRLQAPTQAVGWLQAAGFDLLGLANNHALDFGPAGLAETAQRLQAAGITPLGAGPSLEAASQPHFRQMGPVRLAFLALNFVPDPAGQPAGAEWQPGRWDQAQALAAITSAQAQAEAVIVSVHWGREYSLSPDPAQAEAAQAMRDAGADLIIGHHPHVVQGPALLEADQVVIYSLGNFVFDQQFGQTNQGLALRAFFDAQGLRAAQLLPLWAGPQPRLMAPAEAAPLLARLQAPRRQGFTCDPETCYPVADLPPVTRSGLFWGGEIDLTGDGLPEKVRRIAEQAVIYSGGREVWRGDSDWRVVDLALGDPNDDGRWEALLALWKPDKTGTLRSHPFIIGYRWGIYRDIWGGSAVIDPIHEVELGDIDGNGVQELIVLEETDQAGQRAIAIWDWHGWGFSLRWRSPANNYHDLTFIPATGRHPPLITVALSAGENPIK